MSMPKRIQRKRTKGWRMPSNAVYVGRPTKWGNPYIVGKTIAECTGDHCFAVVEDAQGAVDEYRHDLTLHLDYEQADIVVPAHPLYDQLHELAGMDLACWCPLDQPCHADVLLELANRPGAPTDNDDEEIKAKIKQYFEERHGEKIYPDELSEYFDIPLIRAISLCEALKDEGKLAAPTTP